jgi:hypothetical protein
MQLVDRLASVWGVLPDSDGRDGKTVWFELSASTADPDRDPDDDGDPDLDALLDSFDDPDPSPTRTLRLPDTDIACGTRPQLPGDTTTANPRRRVRAAA